MAVLPRVAAPTMRVVPNPYVAVDEHGRPCGVTMLDPVDHLVYRDNPKHTDASRRWQDRQFVGTKRVSTRMTADKTLRVGSVKHVTVGKHDHAWDHAIDPVEVPATNYYRRAVMSGDLYAADLATWVEAGGNPQLFQEPLEKLAQAKEGAIERFVRMHGAGDRRLPNLVSHWADKIENRHPVAKKLLKPAAAALSSAPAPTAALSSAPAAAPTSTSTKVS